MSPTWVPQMKDGQEVMQTVKRRPGVAYPVLTPNLKGLERALAAGAEEVAVFASATESFSKRNINSTIAESLERYRPVITRSLELGIKTRGYVSCVVGCPYEGRVQVDSVRRVAAALFSMGCYEVCFWCAALLVAFDRARARFLWAIPLALARPEPCHACWLAWRKIFLWTTLPFTFTTRTRRRCPMCS